jgi:hypothetical protein
MATSSPTSSTTNPKTPEDAARMQAEAQQFQLAMFGLQNQGDKNKAMIALLQDSSRKISS